MSDCSNLRELSLHFCVGVLTVFCGVHGITGYAMCASSHFRLEQQAVECAGEKSCQKLL